MISSLYYYTCSNYIIGMIYYTRATKNFPREVHIYTMTAFVFYLFVKVQISIVMLPGRGVVYRVLTPLIDLMIGNIN